jgi:hypothetical protein
MGWQITLSGFVFAAMLAADGAAIKSNVLAGYGVLTAIILFPILFLIGIAHFSKRIDRLSAYLDADEAAIPENWMAAHKTFGLSVSGVGSVLFVAIVISQLGVNLFLAYCRLL